jgi:C4-dicarboxylate-specific signal transduction histidine kinase
MPRDARHSPRTVQVARTVALRFRNRRCITGFIFIARFASSVRRPVLVLLSRCGDCQYMVRRKGPRLGRSWLQHSHGSIFFHSACPYVDFEAKRGPVFLTFVSCQVAASLLSSWRRQTEDSLRHARDELEVKVGERTAELKNANETLLNQIAEQRRTEESLEITRTELARVARITTIGELTASIAHEVNQPLAAVVSNADACVAWLSHQNPNLGEARAAAERTVHGATRASEVIVQIRSLINKTTPERKRVHINEIIEDTVALVNFQGMRNNVSVAIELTPDLPVVFGDRIQLQQVVLNLMMNGIEAMTAVTDRPRKLLVRSQMQDAGQVHVSVQDSGIGVSAEVMARLFEPFFTTRSKGIGMGLPISRSIIEAHGGRLWAESTVSQGSIFQFMLPSADGPVA